MSLGTERLRILREQKARKERAAISAYNSLIATPANFANPLTLPQGALLFVKLGASVTLATAICSVEGSNRYIGPTTAGRIVKLAYFDAQATLTAVYSASSIDLYVRDGAGRFLKIATKV